VNEKANKPEEKKMQLREITDEELETILAEHKKWLETDGREGKRADLARTNLSGKSLFKADLRQAFLIDSDLSGADLGNAKFQEALLDRTVFKNAKIYETNFQDAKLPKANFEAVTLLISNFENAVLENANLQKAKMIDINGLNTADLQDCNFEGAIGLKGAEFARADITGAKLPEDIRDFKILKIVEETSKNARKIFLAMLLGCVYSWLTIATTTDVNLLTNSSSSPLPIIRTAIPIAWFYLTAPILLLGFYLYMHFYLHRLWEGLAGLPARFEDGKRLDERTYPWLLNGLVRRHFDKIKSKRLSIARLEEWVSILLAWLLVPITMCCFWLRYIPRHHWTGTILHITLITLSIAAGIIFYRSHVRTLREKKPPRWRTYLAVTLAILTVMASIVLSNGSINGIRSERIPKIIRWFGYDVFADFYEKDVSARPDNYWLIAPEARENSIIGASLKGCDLRQLGAARAFLAKADMGGAWLERAYLLDANLEGALLISANLKVAFLKLANLEKANLREANLVGADLLWARLAGADLRGANLTYARNLTQEQLNAACGDSKTKLPPGLTIPDCPKKKE
jgi:uncharacterized protein YjbI with pentapeptide repeats